MTRNHRQNRHLTAMARQVSDTLPTVEVVGYDTVPMTGEQYAAAVQALAVLITQWRAQRPDDASSAEGQLAALRPRRRLSPRTFASNAESSNHQRNTTRQR